jgi:MerR family mercuric resistance operon transcriptional regulator
LHLCSEACLTIGMLAKRAGVTVETIRFYQRRGLLAEPEKPFKGVRRYTEQDAWRLRFIKQTQKIGFSLNEILELLNLEDGRRRDVRSMILDKLASIRQRIEELRAMEKNLSDLADGCLRNTHRTSCPTLTMLREQTSGGNLKTPCRMGVWQRIGR